MLYAFFPIDISAKPLINCDIMGLLKLGAEECTQEMPTCCAICFLVDGLCLSTIRERASLSLLHAIPRTGLGFFPGQVLHTSCNNERVLQSAYGSPFDWHPFSRTWAYLPGGYTKGYSRVWGACLLPGIALTNGEPLWWSRIQLLGIVSSLIFTSCKDIDHWGSPHLPSRELGFRRFTLLF